MFYTIFVVLLVRNVGKTISEEYQLLAEYEDELMKVRNIKVNTSKIAFNGIVAFVLCSIAVLISWKLDRK